MSEETETNTAATVAETRAVAVQAPASPPPAVVRERLIAHSNVAIWDSAALEHMGRVGAIMADSGLMSDTFLKDGDNEAPRQMVVARCVMVANLARECEADPLMLLQDCAIISRKLHISGKAVNAIIRKRTGVNLRFVFGRWNIDHIEFPERHPEGHEMAGELVDPTYFHNIGERLAVRALDPNDPERYVDGSVGLWKTERRGSPWSRAGDWRRQLRYRSAPEWARAYEPGAILGLYSEADGLDDVEMIEPRGRPAKRDLSAKLAGNQNGGEGFDGDGIKATISDAAGETPHDPETGQVIGGEEGELPPAEVGPAPPKARDEINGPAPMGVVYMLKGDPVSDAGRVPTYKDGEKHSTCAAKGAAELARYTMHPTSKAADDSPIPADDADDSFPGDKPAPQVGETVAAETMTAEEIAEEWEPLERNEGPAPRGVEYTLESDDIEGDTVQAYEDGEPTRRVTLRDFVTLPEYEAHPEPAAEDEEPPEGTIYDPLLNETTWDGVKKLLPGIYKTMGDQGMSWDDQEAVRRQIWAKVVIDHLGGRHKIEVKPTLDPSGYHLWRATQAGPEGAAIIEDVFAKLQDAPIFKGMPSDARERITGITTATCAALRK